MTAVPDLKSVPEHWRPRASGTPLHSSLSFFQCTIWNIFFEKFSSKINLLAPVLPIRQWKRGSHDCDELEPRLRPMTRLSPLHGTSFLGRRRKMAQCAASASGRAARCGLRSLVGVVCKGGAPRTRLPEFDHPAPQHQVVQTELLGQRRDRTTTRHQKVTAVGELARCRGPKQLETLGSA